MATTILVMIDGVSADAFGRHRAETLAVTFGLAPQGGGTPPGSA